MATKYGVFSEPGVREQHSGRAPAVQWACLPADQAEAGLLRSSAAQPPQHLRSCLGSSRTT